MKDRYGMQAQPSRKIACWQRGEDWLLQKKAVTWNKARIQSSMRHVIMFANPGGTWNIVHAEERQRPRWAAGDGHTLEVFKYLTKACCWPKDRECVNRTVIWEDGSRTRSKLRVRTPEKMQVADNKNLNYSGWYGGEQVGRGLQQEWIRFQKLCCYRRSMGVRIRQALGQTSCFSHVSSCWERPARVRAWLPQSYFPPQPCSHACVWKAQWEERLP